MYYLSAKSQTCKGAPCEFKTVDAGQVDDAVRFQLHAMFGTDAALKQAVTASQTPTETAKKQTAVDRLEQDVKKLERKITNIENVMFENGASINGTATLKQTKAELAQAQTTLSIAKNDLENSMTDENIDRMVSRLRADFHWFERMAIEDQKRLLSRYVEAVVLKRSDDPLGRQISVDLKFKVAVVGDEPDTRPRSLKGLVSTNRVKTTAEEYGRVESLEETVKRLRSGSTKKKGS